MITFTEVAALAVAVEIVATVFKLRAPGMTLDRIPMFVWSMLVTSFLVVFAMPSIMVASTSLILDRLVGTHFFDPVAGGNVLLWQHLFWFFGHPEVYIIFLPATGMVSTIIAVFSRRPVFGYPALVLSLISVGISRVRSLGASHVCDRSAASGASFFTASSMLIAIPNGVQIFCWLATLLGRQAGIARPCCSRWLRRDLCRRRPDRRHGRVRALRPPGDTTPISSWRISTTCSSEARCSRWSGASTTGFRRSPAGL